MNSNKSDARHFNRLASSITSRVALVVIATGALTSAAFAAQTCSGLKQSIDDHGAYLYHYKDQRQPSLDLYVRYVKDQDKCDADRILESRVVPDLSNCYVPTCVIGPGPDDR